MTKELAVMLRTNSVPVSKDVRKTRQMEIPPGGILNGVQWEVPYGISAKAFLMMSSCGVLTMKVKNSVILKTCLKNIPPYVPDLGFQNAFKVGAPLRGYEVPGGMYAEIEFVDAPSEYDEDGNPTSFFSWDSFPDETKVWLLLHGVPRKA
jgi:hypothetical protein